MTVYELLSAYKPMLSALENNGYQMHNIRDVEIYEQYQRMTAPGDKGEYVFATIGDQYKVGRSTIYRILRKMKKTAKV